jgi:hypothetical protein
MRTNGGAASDSGDCSPAKEPVPNPRQAEVEAALAAFQRRADAGRLPKRRYGRVVGGIVGSHRHQSRKRERQRQTARDIGYGKVS